MLPNGNGAVDWELLARALCGVEPSFTDLLEQADPATRRDLILACYLLLPAEQQARVRRRYFELL